MQYLPNSVSQAFGIGPFGPTDWKPPDFYYNKTELLKKALKIIYHVHFIFVQVIFIRLAKLPLASKQIN